MPKPKARNPVICSVLKEHFGKSVLHELVTATREFPATVRLDLQTALAEVLSGPLQPKKTMGAHAMHRCEESLLNRLLNEMDGLREDALVLFVLTTNRPDQLEEALTSRPGRIDQAIEFPLPDEEGRRKLLQLYSGGLALPDALLSLLVQKTKGGSGAFIKELMRRSAQFLVETGAPSLDERHIESALDEMLFSGGSLNAKLLGFSAKTEA
jgi:SpoVK/Ycf46/Vps4 family AAA+-type ATPase